MNRKFALIITTAFAAACVTGCGKTTEKTNNGKLVTTQQVMADTYDIKLSYQGVVKSKETKNYSFRTGGKVEAVYVTEGQLVHKGDKIAQLDAADIESSAAQSANNETIAANNLDKTEATYLTNITNAQINISTLQNSLSAIDSNIAAYRQSIKAAEQGVAALEKAISTDDAQITAAEENIAAYESKLESTRQTVDLAKTNLERIEQLYEQGAVAKSELENMQVQYDDAEASYSQALAQQSTNKVNLEQLKAGHESNLASLESSRAQVQAMYAQLDTLNSQRTQAAAQIATSQKELANLKNSMNSDVGSSAASEKITKLATEQAERAVGYATITADTDGYVMLVNIKAGEMTGAGTPVVIVKSKTKVVSIGVSLDDYSSLGSVTEISINGDTAGQIDNIDQYPDEGSRTYTVDIAFDNDELTMGEIADVELVTARAEGVFIPIDSVINMDGIDYVYRVNNDNTVTRMQVELGEVKNNMVQARNLTNERIVTSGMKSLKDNDKIIDAAAAESGGTGATEEGGKEADGVL
ncbi:MAG: biotin/lipoyl-binding protein [Candidatus Ornithomonoglobus sp.]